VSCWAGGVATAFPPSYDTSWKQVIEGQSCPASSELAAKEASQPAAQLTCELVNGIRKFRFPPGVFDIDVQVEVTANTHIEGNANPIDSSDKSREPAPADQTYFLATRGVSSVHVNYCGTNSNMQQGDAQNLRIGFLLNSNTLVKHINYQGMDTVRPYDNGNLCGGAVFETPGCVSPGLGDGVGVDWYNAEKRQGCYDHAGNPNNLILGDGKGVENVVIESVRLNGMKLGEYADRLADAPGSQVAVWVAMTQDGSATKNVRVTNLVSMLSRGDGINYHGNVQNSIVEDCHIENTGDDIYAAWGAYSENPHGIVFRNNVGKNPGVTRNYGYGVCLAIYGIKEINVTGLKCYDLGSNDWNPGQVPRGDDKCKYGANCNSCLGIVHDGWFGAVYPSGNKIWIYNNEYMDLDGNPIPASERPQVRINGDNPNVLQSADAEVVNKMEIPRSTLRFGIHNKGAKASLPVALLAVATVGAAGLLLRRRGAWMQAPAGGYDNGLLIE